jgi:hypothetical protein
MLAAEGIADDKGGSPLKYVCLEVLKHSQTHILKNSEHRCEYA